MTPARRTTHPYGTLQRFSGGGGGGGGGNATSPLAALLQRELRAAAACDGLQLEMHQLREQQRNERSAPLRYAKP